MAAVPSPVAGLGLAAQATDYPRSFRISGRHAALENSDINGEYVYINHYNGYPAYRCVRDSQTVIRFFNKSWLLDRNGFRNSGACTAWAKVYGGHPAKPDHQWFIWESSKGAHVLDTNVVATDAPTEITLCGRQPDRENFVCNGKYILQERCVHSRASYCHETEDFYMWYAKPEARWVITDGRMVGHPAQHCAIWADTTSTSTHPLDLGLQWHFWEPSRGNFVHDPLVGVVTAPGVVSVICQQPDPQSQSARIVGAYQLCGVEWGKPVYRQPVTGAIIRYSPNHDWWLIDAEGRAQPGFFNKCVAYLTQGSAEAANDCCTAHASAKGGDHPGMADLRWNVWDNISQRHRLDPTLVCTAAPEIIQVTRRAAPENDDIAGEYSMVMRGDGKPIYVKQGIAIFFSNTKTKWLISRAGRTHSGALSEDAAVAYADVDTFGDMDYPTKRLSWFVFDSTRRLFSADPSMSTIAVQTPELNTAINLTEGIQFNMMPGGPPVQQPIYGVNKRELFMEPEFAPYLQGPEPKRVRRDNQGWLGSLFGA